MDNIIVKINNMDNITDKYYLVSKDDMRERNRQWKLKNPEVVKEHSRRGMKNYLNRLTAEEKKEFYKKMWIQRKERLLKDPVYQMKLKEKNDNKLLKKEQKLTEQKEKKLLKKEMKNKEKNDKVITNTLNKRIKDLINILNKSIEELNELN